MKGKSHRGSRPHVSPTALVLCSLTAVLLVRETRSRLKLPVGRKTRAAQDVCSCAGFYKTTYKWRQRVTCSQTRAQWPLNSIFISRCTKIQSCRKWDDQNTSWDLYPRLTQQRWNWALKPLFELQVHLFDIMHYKKKHWINVLSTFCNLGWTSRLRANVLLFAGATVDGQDVTSWRLYEPQMVEGWHLYQTRPITFTLCLSATSHIRRWRGRRRHYIIILRAKRPITPLDMFKEVCRHLQAPCGDQNQQHFTGRRINSKCKSKPRCVAHPHLDHNIVTKRSRSNQVSPVFNTNKATSCQMADCSLSNVHLHVRASPGFVCGHQASVSVPEAKQIHNSSVTRDTKFIVNKLKVAT